MVKPLRALRTRESNRKEVVVACRVNVALGNHHAKVVDTSGFGPGAAREGTEIPDFGVASRGRLSAEARLTCVFGKLRRQVECLMMNVMPTHARPDRLGLRPRRRYETRTKNQSEKSDAFHEFLQ